MNSWDEIQVDAVLQQDPAHMLKGIRRDSSWFAFGRSALRNLLLAGITTAMLASFKGELPQAVHNFTITTGNVFKVALIKVTPTGTYDKTSTNYSNITGNSDELAASGGYSTGGFAFTAAQNVTPATDTTSSNNIAYWGFSVNPSWTSATFSTTGCMYYNSSASNKGVAVFDFGGTQTVSAGTFTIVQPTTSSALALFRLT